MKKAVILEWSRGFSILRLFAWLSLIYKFRESDSENLQIPFVEISRNDCFEDTRLE